MAYAGGDADPALPAHTSPPYGIMHRCLHRAPPACTALPLASRSSQAREVPSKDASLCPVDCDEDAIPQAILLREVDAAPQREASLPSGLDLLLVAAADGDLHERLRLANVGEDAEVELKGKGKEGEVGREGGRG